jgi:hypothetical protein
VTDTSSRTHTSTSTNIFDDLPALQESTATAIQDELAIYLSTGRDLGVKDGLRWWYEHKHLYPHLSRMAIDYLSIPGVLIPSFDSTDANAHGSDIS